jgi:type III secretion protein R
MTPDSSFGTVALLAALALVPFVVVVLTSFAKIAVVLSILRNALGAPEVPPAIVITGVALVLSLAVMAPVGAEIYREVEPALARKDPAALVEAAGRAREPVRRFLVKHAHARDVEVFRDVSRKLRGADVAADDLAVLAPAFVTSELKEAFTIGFLVFLPFLVIDLLVSAVLAALGLASLPAPAVALPFKLLLFVLVDGWLLLGRGLMLGYL